MNLIRRWRVGSHKEVRIFYLQNVVMKVGVGMEVGVVEEVRVVLEVGGGMTTDWCKEVGGDQGTVGDGGNKGWVQAVVVHVHFDFPLKRLRFLHDPIVFLENAFVLMLALPWP